MVGISETTILGACWDHTIPILDNKALAQHARLLGDIQTAHYVSKMKMT